MIVPPFGIDVPDFRSGALPSRPAMRNSYLPSIITNPPRASAGRTHYSANIDAPKSVAEVVYGATPVAGAVDLVKELQDRRPRPALPPGWRAKLAANSGRVLPPGLRQRIVVWERNLIRLRPDRQTPPVPVPRE